MLVLCIHDDGKGCDESILEEQPESQGLHGMRDRLELIGGELQFETAPDEGTSATIRVPADAAQTP